MFTSNDSIKFMIAKIFFNLAEFSFDEINKSTNSKYHGIDTLQVFYIKEGNGLLLYENESYELKAGTYFSIPPLKKYSILPKNNLDIYSTYFVINKTTGYKRYFYLLEQLNIGNNINLSNLFDTIIYELKTKQIGYNEIVVSMFKTILISIIRNENVNGPRLSHWDLDNFQYNIEKEFQNNYKDITLKDLANKLFVSERELQRYLEKNYNKNFTDIKNDAKMSFAQNLLLNTNKSILEIAYETGYSSSEHFSNAFKKYFGKSPLKYKKEINSNH